MTKGHDDYETNLEDRSVSPDQNDYSKPIQCNQHFCPNEKLSHTDRYFS